MKTIKKYANNISVSDEKFFRDFFDYFIDELEIKNKKGESYYFKKSTISDILNSKEDVPTTVRTAISDYFALSAVISTMNAFIEQQINPSRLELLLEDFKSILNSDRTIDKTAKEKICCMSDTECIATIFIESIKAPNTFLKRKQVLWQSGENSLNVLRGDIIKIAFEASECKKIVVIPVNSTFETKLSLNMESDIYPLVSENTIHGKWLKNILQFISKEDLDKRIEKSLSKLETKSVGQCVCLGGKNILYSIGDVAIIQHSDTIFYLLAISNFDEKNKAHSSESLIENSIVRLLEYYDNVGQGYSLYLPLLGTGKSRANLTAKRSYELIKSIVISHSEIVHGNINIVVFDKVVNELI